MNKTEGRVRDEFERSSQQPCPHPNYTAKVTCSWGQDWDLDLTLPRWDPGSLTQAPWVLGFLPAEQGWCIFSYPHCTVHAGPESTLIPSSLGEPSEMKAITGQSLKPRTMRASSWFMRYSCGKSTRGLTGWVCGALGESHISLFLQQ